MKVAEVSAHFWMYSWKVNKRWTSHLLAHLWRTDPKPSGNELSFSAIWPRATTAHKYWWREQCFCLSRAARQITFSGDFIWRFEVGRWRACAEKDTHINNRNISRTLSRKAENSFAFTDLTNKKGRAHATHFNAEQVLKTCEIRHWPQRCERL